LLAVSSQNQIEDLIVKYERALNSAADYYRQINELLTTLDND
jgi:uncharacterized tellurite resistance protein B-like protein